MNFTINHWLETLPNTDLEVDTSGLQTAVKGLLPDKDEIQTLLNNTGVPERIEALGERVESLPDQVTDIATDAEDLLQESLDALQESINNLIERISDLPEEFEGTVTEQLKESADQILEAFSDDIEAKWSSLPDDAKDAMEDALTSGFKSFLDIAQQAEDYFRVEVKNTLSQSEEQLKEHVRQQLNEAKDELETAAIESVEQELVTSNVILTVGSATTSALSPALPYIKAAHLAADAINEALEVYGG